MTGLGRALYFVDDASLDDDGFIRRRRISKVGLILYRMACEIWHAMC
jgi:hypothetical protein